MIFSSFAQIIAPKLGESPESFLSRLTITGKQHFDENGNSSVYVDYGMGKRKVYGQPVNDDVNVDTPVEVVTIEPRFTGKNAWELRKHNEVVKFQKELVGVYKNKQTGWDIKLTGHGVAHAISSSSFRGIGDIEHIEAVANLPKLIENAVLIESHEDGAGQGLNAVHRMYTPIHINNSIFTVKLTVKESKKGLVAEIEDIRKLYDVSLVKEMPYGVADTPHSLENQAGMMPSTQGISEITIRKMLENVNDHDGHPFINKNGTVNYKKDVDNKKDVHNQTYYQEPNRKIRGSIAFDKEADKSFITLFEDAELSSQVRHFV